MNILFVKIHVCHDKKQLHALTCTCNIQMLPQVLVSVERPPAEMDHAYGSVSLDRSSPQNDEKTKVSIALVF